MAERELLVRIVGDDRDLQRALKSTEASTARIDNRMQTFGKSVKTAFGAAGIAIGTSVAFAEIQRSVSAASDLNEQISKSKQVFGDASEGVEDWGKTTATAFGISQRAALTAAGTFGNLFNTVDIGNRQAADMSQTLVELAADLASFNNASPEDVLLALRSGLIGEAEPLRKFGVLLSETRVQQEALAETGKTNVKTLTDQEKALARYHIILQDTKSAQGDFERTSGGLANQQRILAAQVEDLEATLGQVLIPTITGMVGGLNDAIKAAQGLGGALGDLAAFTGIDIPIKFALGGGRGQQVFQDVILGTISPAGLGLKLGKQISDALQGEEVSFEGIDDFVNRTLEDLQDEINTASVRIANAVTNALGDLDSALAGALKRTQKHKLEKSQGAFSAFMKGLGLKLDTKGLTENTSDDLAVLREMEHAILRQIRAEGRTFKLAQDLVNVRQQIADVVAQQLSNAAQKQEDAVRAIEEAAQKSQVAFDAIIDGLSLDLEIAQASKSLADDKVALRAMEKAILDRIKVEGKTTDLLRQLFEVRQQQEEIARQLREQQQARRQANQFKALGLTDEGEERTPGARSLLRRAQSLEDRIKGTVLDTEKNRATLNKIERVLTEDPKRVGRNVRKAIQDMMDTIAGAFDPKKSGAAGAGGVAGEFTRGGIRSTQKLLKGLGLTAEQAAELTRRNLGVSSGSHTSAFGLAVGGGRSGRASTTGGDFVITGPITVVTNDPNDLMKKLQKKGRRSSGGRRGRFGGANLGLQ